MVRLIIFLLFFYAVIPGYGSSMVPGKVNCPSEAEISPVSGMGETVQSDSLHEFARFLYTEHESSYWMVRLGFFNSSGQRLKFYNLAYQQGIFMGDKALLDSDRDSTWFYTDLPVEEAGKQFRELFPEALKSPPLKAPSAVIDCSTASVACSENVYSFPSGTTTSAPPPVAGYPNYGCLGSRPGPAWYYMQVGTAGNIIISISQKDASGAGLDVDFVCWGPFQNLADGCATGLTGACVPSGTPYCCTNTSPTCVYPKGNMVDCSFDPAASEVCHILNGQVGDIYILLLTNYSQDPGTISFSQTGGIGRTNCNLVYHCSLVSITRNPTACSSPSNTFSVSGSIAFTNPPPTGTLTISDGSAIPVVSQVFTPPFVSPISYNLTGIPCDGLNHTLTASFSDSTNCFLTGTVSAPVPICPQAQISGGGSVCNDGVSTVPVYVTLSGPGPYSFSYAIDGVLQPPVTGYNGPAPYELSAVLPGTYTLVSVTNPSCVGSGSVSGSVVVGLLPLPVPALTGSISVCEGSSGNRYETEPGKSDYSWVVSPGGIITAGGNGFNFAIVSWMTPGPGSVAVSYRDGNGCLSASPTILPVTVNQKQTVSIVIAASVNPVCAGTPVTFTETDINGGVSPSYQWKANSVNIPAGNGSSCTYIPVAGDQVSCMLTSGLSCVVRNTVQSNIITMQTLALPLVSFKPCVDTITTAKAAPFILRGGLPLGGTYSGPGVNSATGIFTPSLAGIGKNDVLYSYTNLNNCVASFSARIFDYAEPVFNCGSLLKDLRDNKTYPTILIGSQCWMASDLDFGTTISGQIPQTDNCIAEKYKTGASGSGPAWYQWDELMQYNTSPGTKGICPPGWHVPTHAEWDALLSNFYGSGRAGGPLKDSLSVTGFHSQQKGFLYLNNSWSFTSGNFAGSMYWTSSLAGNKAIARGMNQFVTSVSYYPASEGNAFNARCVRDP